MEKLYILLLAVILFTGCTMPSEEDIFAPEISITYPLPFERLGREETITITVDTSDNETVDRVEYYLNDELLCSISEPPFNCQWTTPAENSNLLLTAQAIDSSGNRKITGIVPVLIDGGNPRAMVFVSGGSFMMGDTWGIGEPEESPVHPVTVSDFYISQFEITLDFYYPTLGDTLPEGIFMQIDPRWPKIICTWIQAVEFCNALSLQENLTPCYTQIDEQYEWDKMANGYRLPTEAEWEFAARGGNNDQDYMYSGSNILEEVAWFTENCVEPKLIGSKAPNALNIYDMTGNAEEWCWDWADTAENSYYQQCFEEGIALNPSGIATGDRKVLRGGSWRSSESLCYLARRNNMFPDLCTDTSAFRIVRNAD